MLGADGLGVLRQGLKQRASRLPNFDFDYIDAALTILRTALEIKNYYMVALLNQVDLTPARLGLLMALFLCEDQAVLASELADLMVVTPGNITGLVDGLTKDRLVRALPIPVTAAPFRSSSPKWGVVLSAGSHRSTFD